MVVLCAPYTSELVVLTADAQVKSSHQWTPMLCLLPPSVASLVVADLMVSQVCCHMTREQRQKVVLSYDNMCHVDNLRIARKPLESLPGDLKFIWLDIKKIIDSLHIHNHKDTQCHQRYNPDQLKETNPYYNTMSCEQTFAWFSRYKKILGAMGKVHHHFYLHRMVKRRNSYISYCYSNGRRPIQPRQ